jgi:chromosome partitioning protein
MSNVVYVGGQKGGTTKTTTSHLMGLGAILRKQPAAYVLTDPNRRVKAEGRPYGVLDGRDTNKLAQILTASRSNLNGWLIVDGGGNRPAFDQAMAEQANLTILPFRASEEDLEAVALDMQAMPNAIALPSAWSTNKHAQQAAQRYIDALSKAFPGRVMASPIWFVNSAAELLGASLESPSTAARNAARHAFDVLTTVFDAHAELKHDDEAAITHE